jgi:hypothetical protein
MENALQSQEQNNLGYYTTLVSGSLLVVSELLPYISKIKGNGIIQVITNLFTKYEENKQKEKAERDQKIQEIVLKVDEAVAILKRLEEQVQRE